MARVIHFRVEGLEERRLERLHEQAAELAVSRVWRSGPVWVASALSTGLFESEYFRHLRAAYPNAVAGGFLKMAGDETDALVLVFFLRDLSAEYSARCLLLDEENPLAKLREVTFDSGLLANGRSLEEHLARRPIHKKVQGQSIVFYPPSYRVHTFSAGKGQWGYSLQGLRAYAPSLREAEAEALKLLRGWRHLDG